jgi:hypothetical protein
MSQFDSTLAQQAYYWAIKALHREIEDIEESTLTPWWKFWEDDYDLSQEQRDRIIVLKELEKRFRKHREGLGTRKGK